MSGCQGLGGASMNWRSIEGSQGNEAALHDAVMVGTSVHSHGVYSMK